MARCRGWGGVGVTSRTAFENTLKLFSDGLSLFVFLIPLFSLLLHRELDHNDISGTIEDTNGAFSGLDKLRKL